MLTDAELNIRAEASMVAAINVLTAETARRGAPPDSRLLAEIALTAADVLVRRLDAALPLDGAQTRTVVAALLGTALGALVGVAITVTEERLLRLMMTPPLKPPPEGPPA